MGLSAGKKIITLGKEALDNLGGTKLTEKLQKSYLDKGKKSNKSSTVKDDFEKVVTEGKDGKGKTISYIRKGSNLSKDKQVSKRAENLAKKQKKTKKVTPTDTPVKKLASDATTKRNIKNKIGKAEKVFSRKEYNKKLLDNLKNNKNKKISKNTTKNKTKQSTALTVTNQPSKKTGTNLVTIPKGTNIVKKKTTSLTTIPKSSGAATSNKILNFLKRNKGKIALGAGAALLPFAVGTDKNPSEGSISDGGNKNKKPPKDFTPKIKTPKTPKVIKKELPKVKSNDYTGRFIDKKGDVAYDSFSDFMAHMTGKPKKRKMPKKTARIIGTGDKLKRKDADKKGAGKGVKFKAFKSGTKDKTVKKSGGGLIAGLYDKPEKTEKHKGNSTSARQIKGYGKARRKA